MVKTLLKIVKQSDCNEKKCVEKEDTCDGVYYEMVEADSKRHKYDPIEIHIHIPPFFSMMPWLSLPYWKIA